MHVYLMFECVQCVNFRALSRICVVCPEGYEIFFLEAASCTGRGKVTCLKKLLFRYKGKLDTLSYVSLGVMGANSPVLTATPSTLLSYIHILSHACTREKNI